MKTRGNRLDPNAFPHFQPFLEDAQEYAKISGGRFLPHEFTSVLDRLKADEEGKTETDEETAKRRQRSASQCARDVTIARLLPRTQEFAKKLRAGNKELTSECYEAQRIIFREGVEKACYLCVQQIDDFDPDPNLTGDDWSDLTQDPWVLASKVSNFGDTRWSPNYKRLLLTALFVSDFGLFCGVDQVSFQELRDLLANFLKLMDKVKQRIREEKEELEAKAAEEEASRASFLGGALSKMRGWLTRNDGQDEDMGNPPPAPMAPPSATRKPPVTIKVVDPKKQAAAVKPKSPPAGYSIIFKQSPATTPRLAQAPASVAPSLSAASSTRSVVDSPFSIGQIVEVSIKDAWVKAEILSLAPGRVTVKREGKEESLLFPNDKVKKVTA